MGYHSNHPSPTYKAPKERKQKSKTMSVKLDIKDNIPNPLFLYSFICEQNN